MICFLKSLIVPHTHSRTQARAHTHAHACTQFTESHLKTRTVESGPEGGRLQSTYCSLEIEPASIRGVEMVIKPLLKPYVIKNPRGCKNHKGHCRLQGLIVIIWTVNPEP